MTAGLRKGARILQFFERSLVQDARLAIRRFGLLPFERTQLTSRATTNVGFWATCVLEAGDLA
jgi:hypothetical protein